MHNEHASQSKSEVNHPNLQVADGHSEFYEPPVIEKYGYIGQHTGGYEKYTFGTQSVGS